MNILTNGTTISDTSVADVWNVVQGPHREKEMKSNKRISLP
jgi:hypothetical protein